MLGKNLQCNRTEYEVKPEMAAVTHVLTGNPGETIYLLPRVANSSLQRFLKQIGV